MAETSVSAPRPDVTRRRPLGTALALKLGLLAGSLLVALLLAEAGTRIIGKVRGVDFTLYMQELSNSNRLPKGLQSEHPSLRWALSPGANVLATTSDFSVAYKVNSKGLRDREYAYDKPAGITRILALGDSFTFGEGIPYGERYTDVAEASFESLEVLTMAVPGWGLDQMLLSLAEEGVKYRPDIVLLMINTANVSRHALGPDWLRGAQIGQIAADASKDRGPTTTIYRRADDPLLQGNSNVLFRSSHLLSYLNYQLTLRRLRQQMVDSDKAKWGRDTYDPKRALAPDGPAARLYDAELALAVGRLAALAQQFKFRILIANTDPVWAPRVDLFALPPDTKLLDFSEPLRAEAHKRSLTFTYDPHFNPATNRFIGELLAAGLKAHVPGLRAASGKVVP